MPSSASSTGAAKLESPTIKGVQCSMCEKKFSRTDHLKRHQLRLTIFEIIIPHVLNGRTIKYLKLLEAVEGPMHVTHSRDVIDNFGNSSENESVPADSLDEESIDWSLFEEEDLLQFLSSPFDGIPVYGPERSITGWSHTGGWEPPSPQSAAIVDSILAKAASLHLSPPEQAHISQNLNFLFTPSRIDKFVGFYFEFWHPHCTIVHQATFTVDAAPIPLLISVVVMGAIYSQVDTEANTAKLVLDLVELYLFSLEDLSDEYEIRHMLRVPMSSASDSIQLSVLAFQHLQAAYLIVCVQFWAGSMMARKRVSDNRFSVLVKVARRLGLTKARHGMINTMTLLDCGFCFFTNFPCRISLSEMKFDLPSEDSFFASVHPFQEPNFSTSRNMTTREAYQGLFKPSQVPAQGTKGNPLGLSPMDMFILIHLLYVSAHAQILHFPQSLSLQLSPDSSGSSTPLASPNTSPPTSNISLIKIALSHWRSLWITIRSSIPSTAWARLGFFRNGYHYWLITQLIISNKRSADVLLGMEVGCEDTLQQLKQLLKDGGGVEGLGAGLGNGSGNGEGSRMDVTMRDEADLVTTPQPRKW
ncbi:uncharacterized protein RSE6_14444 [Rhynchosporium secalis]|uniref:C2H2-type domain-containing protein n=1 Tax=Rhynchosporium secalis TaxID=38038 RepID=A0A1E1MVA6_RHYSE|nr:uncharacterized protein RSE6_14444 [Rhynchosporium secalis]